jgi:plasmid segregation protein ParM
MSIVIGVDDGYAGTKIFGDNVAGDGVQKGKIPSRARSGVHAVTAIFGENDSDAYLCEDESGSEKWTVGTHIEGEDTRFDHYPTSAMNRAIVNHALNQNGYSGQKVEIVTGLPFNAYYRVDGTYNIDLIKNKQDSLKKPVKRSSGAESAVVVKHHVLGEAVCAVVDTLVDESGKMLDKPGMNAVVDIGGKTTDICVVTPQPAIDHKRSGTKDLGMLNVYEAIRRQVGDRFGVNSLQDQAIRDSVRTGEIEIWGNSEDIKDIVTQALSEEAENITREATRRFGDGADLKKIILVGGGADPMFPFLKDRFRNLVRPEEPEFANARGMYKFVKFIKNKSA